jgi:hypothetical protein
MQRTSCNNCQHRLAHHMQCGRSGIYVQAFGVCNDHQPAAAQPQAKEPA